MNSALHCQLLFPGVARELAAGLESPPAMRTWLRCAQRGEAVAEGVAGWLCRRFGVARQQDVPAAPFAALGDGLQPDGAYWLHAEPVSLVLQRDSFALAGVPSGLRPEQAEALVDALNRHFSPDGMRFHVAAADRWYLSLATRPDLRTHPLAQVLGRDIQPYLPQGGDGLKWHGLINELQMLLHAHPVNAGLEQAGAMPVNSVWLWGGGARVAGVPHPELSVWANDALARGLAMSHQSRVAALPASAEDWLQQAQHPGEHLVVLPALHPSAPQQDLEQWEHDWFAPLLAMLKSRKLASATLHLAGETVTGFTVTRRDLMKFWRRAQPLERYLG